MIEKVLKLIFIFVVGVVGGIFADQIFWPYFVERPLFYQYRLEQPPVYLTERNEITVTENVALQNAVEIVERSVVGVRTITPGGKIITGSGIAITSDGLIVTLAELVPKGGKFVFFVDGRTPNWQILKRDLKSNLALIKLEESGLATVGFAEFGSLRFGQRVFLVGTMFKNGNLPKVVNEGIIKTYNKEVIETNILENNKINGSPLFNIEGKLVGLDVIDTNNMVKAIPINKIRDFAGF